MRIERWHLAVLAVCAAACQVLSGLDDLEADGKAKTGAATGADAGDAASGDSSATARDAGDDSDSGSGVAGRAEVASAGTGGAGGAAGAAGEGGSSGSAGSEPPQCRPPVSRGACDPVVQCGCGSSENCVFYEGKLACVAEGGAQPYAACSADHDCSKGYQCVGGVCAQSCHDASDKSCSGDSARCEQVAFNGTPVSGNYVCTRSCNPAHPQRDDDRFDACGPALGCTTFVDHSDCITATAAGVAGATCKRDGDCAPGLYCSVSMVCEKWCEVGSSDCGAGASCTGFASKEYAVKSAEFGVCCAPPAGKGPCDTSPQCGCGNDQRCDFAFTNGKADGSTACLPIGSAAAYAACTSQSSCGRGYSCTDRACRMLCDLTRVNSCVSYSEFSRCLPVQVNGVDVPGWGVCSQVCNPAAPFKSDSRFTACVNGTYCRHMGNGETNCLPIADAATAVGKTGDSCDGGGGNADGTRCAPGYFCEIGSLTCVQYCEVGVANACLNGASCASFAPAAQVASIELGYCQ